MVYAKTFTTFARHAFQKAAFAGHAPNGAGHASSFFNQSFAGAGRSQLGSGAIANRFQSQFGAHAGKNNPNPSQPNTQTTLHGQLQTSLAAATTNDDSTKDQDVQHRPSLSLTRHIQTSIFTSSVSSTDISQPAHARAYSTSVPSQASDEHDAPYSEITPSPNLPSSSPDYIAPTLESYETHVTNLMEQGDFGSVISVYHDMKRNGFVPTARLYNNIILSMTRTRAREPVNAIVETYTEMLDQQVQPEITTVSTVIEALCKRSTEVNDIIAESKLRIERDATDATQEHEKVGRLMREDNVSIALDLFNASTNAMFQPHPIDTFNAILGALSNHGMAQEVLQVYEKMEVSQIKPNVTTFVHLITAFGKHGDMRSAIECYNEYKSQALQLPNHDENIIYEALISSYFASGDASGGIEFLSKVRSVPAKYISRRLLDAVVSGFCQRGDLEAAMKWVHEMKQTGTLPKPTVSTIRPVVLSASREGNLAIAKEAFELLGDGRIATAHLWRTELHVFANLCLKEGDLPTAVIVMDELVLQKMLPDSDVAAAFLQKLVQSSGLDRALEFFERFANVHQNTLSNYEHSSEFEALTQQFINDLGTVDIAAATRIILTLEPFPNILTQLPSSAARILVSAFKSLPEGTFIDGPTLAGIVKFQSCLAGWQDSRPDDVGFLVSVLCSIRPEEWMYLRASESVISEHILRIRDQDLIGLWTEIMSSIDLINGNRMSSPLTPTTNPAPSIYSPDDAASVATLDTSFNMSNSASSPYATPMRQLPTQYHFNKPRAPDFNIPMSIRMIRSLGRAQKDTPSLNKALDIVRFTRRKGERLLPEALGRLINVAGKAHRVDIVSEAFEFAQTTLREVIPEHEVAFTEWCLILNSMIVANAFNRNFADARYYQQELLSLGVAPDSDAFAAYIVNLDVTDTNDEATEALALFHEAKSLGVRPSTFLYNTLISKLAKARRSDDALYYFHEMRANGIPPTSVTFGTVINACCRVGNETLALKYFNEMETDQHFVPRIAPYNTMLQFYVQTRQDRTEALRFYEKMRAQLLTPSAHTYKLLMDAYATLEPVDLDAAENILKLIASDRQRPTGAHYAALIHAYGCVKQDLESAKRWFYQVIDPQFSNHVAPDEALYQALIEAYVANHRVAECDQVFRHMKSNNVKLTVYMANHLIHGWTVAGNLEEARKVFDSLAAEKNGLYGREPSSYEQMTRTYVALGDRQSAHALVDEMKTKGYPAAVVARVTDILEGGEGFGGLLHGGSPIEMGTINRP